MTPQRSIKLIGGLVTCLLAAGATPRARAAEVLLEGRSLNSVLDELSGAGHIEYLLCGNAGEATKARVWGETLEDSVEAVLQAYPVRHARVGSVFIVDAQPPADLKQALLALLPDDTSAAADGRSTDEELQVRLADLWAAEYRGRYQVSTGPDRLGWVPFEVRTDSATGEALVRLIRRRQKELLQSARLDFAFPLDTVTVELRSLGEQRALHAHYKAGLDQLDVDLGWLPSDAGPADGGPWRERLCAALRPGHQQEVDLLCPGYMSAPVDLTGHWQMSGLLRGVSDAAGTAVELADGVSDRPVNARLAPIPAWAALQMVSAASGLRWEPQRVAVRQLVGLKSGTPTAVAYAALAPPERIGALCAEGGGLGTLALLVLSELPDSVRSRLLNGEPVPLPDVTSTPVVARLFDCLSYPAFAGPWVAYAVGLADSRETRADCLRGLFCVHEGAVGARITEHQPLFWYPIGYPGHEAPAWPDGPVRLPTAIGCGLAVSDWVDGVPTPYGDRSLTPALVPAGQEFRPPRLAPGGGETAEGGEWRSVRPD